MQGNTFRTFQITRPLLNTDEDRSFQIGDALQEIMYRNQFTMVLQWRNTDNTTEEITEYAGNAATNEAEVRTNPVVLYITEGFRNHLNGLLASASSGRVLELRVEAAIPPHAGSTTFPANNVPVGALTDEFRKRDLQDRYIIDHIEQQMGIPGPQGPQGEQGLPGPKGDKGDPGAAGIGQRGQDGRDGDRGWTPRFEISTQGGRSVLELAGYFGGEGDEPTDNVGRFVGTNGYVDNIADAIDLTGPTGATGAEGPKGDKGDKGDPGDDGEHGTHGDRGWTPRFVIAEEGRLHVLELSGYIGGEGTQPVDENIGRYLAADGTYVDAIEDALDITGVAGPRGVFEITMYTTTPFTDPVTRPAELGTRAISISDAVGPFYQLTAGTSRYSVVPTIGTPSPGRPDPTLWFTKATIDPSLTNTDMLTVTFSTARTLTGPQGPEGHYRFFLYTNSATRPTNPGRIRVNRSDLNANTRSDFRVYRSGSVTYRLTPLAPAAGQFTWRIGATVNPNFFSRTGTTITLSFDPPVRLTGDRGATGEKGDKGDQGDQGERGPQGEQGDTGNAGWSPVYAIHEQGELHVLELSDYVGGTGTKPSTNVGFYLAANGTFVENAEDALDITGVAGPQGEQGERGETGAKGDKGDQGDQGETGPKGDKGDTGDRGATGTDGDDGDNGWSPNLVLRQDGNRRILQLVGYTGGEGTAPTDNVNSYLTDTGTFTTNAADAADIRGTQGLRGEQGEQGEQGDTGPQGEQGIQGIQGETGPQGDRGLQGPQGTQGETGERGPKGDKGDKGDQGDQGDAGMAGSAGDTGWSPVLAFHESGELHVLELTGYTGGTGTAPTDNVGQYLTATGSFTTDVTEALDLTGRGGTTGPQGTRGWSPEFALADGQNGAEVLQLVDWVGGTGTKPTEGINQYVTEVGLNANIASAVDLRGPRGLQGASRVLIYKVATEVPTPPTGISIDIVTNTLSGDLDGWVRGLPTTVPEGSDAYVTLALYSQTSATEHTIALTFRGVLKVTGPVGPQGDDGNAGWSPVLVMEVVGNDSVLRLHSYIGGEGTAPTDNVGMYLTDSGGFTSNIADAANLRGMTGARGEQGEQGDTGERGPQGDQGEQGDPGTDGTDGDTGWTPVLTIHEDGNLHVLELARYVGGTGTAPTANVGEYLAADGTFTSTVTDALDITGVAGPQGERGEKGDKGDRGDDGDDGARGPKGDKGDTGDRGQTGAEGEPGTRGWSPQIELHEDGTRRVLRLAGYTGGTGPAPTDYVGQYLTSVGTFTTNPAAAANLVGPQGPQGERGAVGPRGRAGTGGRGHDTLSTEGWIWDTAQYTDYSEEGYYTGYTKEGETDIIIFRVTPTAEGFVRIAASEWANRTTQTYGLFEDITL